jgi:molybdopterin synthase sulfur carrier subunit
MTSPGASPGAALGTQVRVVLPAHLRNLAGVHGEVLVHLSVPVLTQRAVLDAVESRFPMLGGTIRDRRTGKRRAFIRFYACEQDLSNEPPDAPLPDAVAAAIAAGTEPFLVVGAMAGG